MTGMSCEAGMPVRTWMFLNSFSAVGSWLSCADGEAGVRAARTAARITAGTRRRRIFSIFGSPVSPEESKDNANQTQEWREGCKKSRRGDLQSVEPAHGEANGMGAGLHPGPAEPGRRGSGAPRLLAFRPARQESLQTPAGPRLAQRAGEPPDLPDGLPGLPRRRRLR